VTRRLGGTWPRFILAIIATAWLGAGCTVTVSPLPATSAPSAGLASPTTPSPTAAPPATPATSWTVTAGGGANVYHYQPLTVIVPANQPVTITLVDGDVLDHTWTAFAADGVTVLANLTVAKAGDKATGTFTFPVPGSFLVWCTIPGHKGFGEVGVLKVVP
jgi:plastocyanin